MYVSSYLLNAVLGSSDPLPSCLINSFLRKSTGDNFANIPVLLTDVGRLTEDYGMKVNLVAWDMSNVEIPVS